MLWASTIWRDLRTFSCFICTWSLNTLIIPILQMRKLRFRETIWLALGYTSRKCWSELELRTSEVGLRPFTFQSGSLLPCPPELLLIEKSAGIKRSTVPVVKLTFTTVCCSDCIWKLIDLTTLPAVGGSQGNKIKMGSKKPNYMRVETSDQESDLSLRTHRSPFFSNQTCWICTIPSILAWEISWAEEPGRL